MPMWRRSSSRSRSATARRLPNSARTRSASKARTRPRSPTMCAPMRARISISSARAPWDATRARRSTATFAFAASTGCASPTDRSFPKSSSATPIRRSSRWRSVLPRSSPNQYDERGIALRGARLRRRIRPNQPRNLLERFRRAEQVALDLGAAERAHVIELLLGLDALDGGDHGDARREAGDALDDGERALLGRDVVDERAV